MAAAVPAERAVSSDVNALLYGMRWNSLALTYSFPQQASVYGSGYGHGEPANNFAPLNAAQMAAARSIFAAVSAATNLAFQEIEETATRHADLRLALSDTPSPAWTYTIDDGAEGGDSWFGQAGGRNESPVPGTYAFWTFLHEIGHALGLKHAHEAGGFGIMPFTRDSMEFTIATYRSHVGAGLDLTNEPNGFAQTLMMDDIAALQHLYGANFGTNSDNTVYRWSAKTGQGFINGIGQAAPNGNRIFMTLWDGGGVDTYDFTNYGSDLTVDLRPGAWSTTSERQLASLDGFFHIACGNIGNAFQYQGDPQSLIENATGGSGNDRMIGNMAANVLRGGKGTDSLTGLQGNDTLIGGAGSDSLRGGAGADVFLFDTRVGRTAADKIADFNVKEDRLYFDDAVFKAIGHGSLAKPKVLKKAFFTIGDQAHDANDAVIYNAKTGALSYDVDGAGGAEAVLVATLSKHLKLTAADIFVV